MMDQNYSNILDTGSPKERVYQISWFVVSDKIKSKFSYVSSHVMKMATPQVAIFMNRNSLTNFPFPLSGEASENVELGPRVHT